MQSLGVDSTPPTDEKVEAPGGDAVARGLVGASARSGGGETCPSSSPALTLPRLRGLVQPRTPSPNRGNNRLPALPFLFFRVTFIFSLTLKFD